MGVRVAAHANMLRVGISRPRVSQTTGGAVMQATGGLGTTRVWRVRCWSFWRVR
jgi:hypothetical protein